MTELGPEKSCTVCGVKLHSEGQNLVILGKRICNSCEASIVASQVDEVNYDLIKEKLKKLFKQETG